MGEAAEIYRTDPEKTHQYLWYTEKSGSGAPSTTIIREERKWLLKTHVAQSYLISR
jgi:hypothetical protein